MALLKFDFLSSSFLACPTFRLLDEDAWEKPEDMKVGKQQEPFQKCNTSLLLRRSFGKASLFLHPVQGVQDASCTTLMRQEPVCL
jgi:hypothetical protein